MRYLTQSVFVVTVMGIVSACGGGGSGNSNPPPPSTSTFQYNIDSSIVPFPDKVGTHATGAVRDSAGQTSVFVKDELIFNATTQSDLDTFLADTGGTVIGDDIVPDPPANSGIILDPKYKQATQYLVRVDTSRIDLATFEADAVRAGLSGKASISDDAAARLLAMAARERAVGLKISPVFVAHPLSYLFKTEEHPFVSGTGFRNALTYGRYSSSSASRTNVARAWQWIAAMGNFTPTKIAILDAGFWLDNTGHPNSIFADPIADLPDPPLQHDFIDHDIFADGENPTHCSNDTVCRWHGNRSAGVAVGTVNNQYGFAGTGSTVAIPMLLKINMDWFNIGYAIRTATAWNADVISMSFGADCDIVFCDGFWEFNLYSALRHARDNNVVLVAAAGNDNKDSHIVPCRNKDEGVICVGAMGDDLGNDTNTRISYSNYGQYVDIWAPTNILTMPDSDSSPNLAIHGGTSASTPFVAGIAAMLKAFNPSLSSSQVRDIFKSTAWTDSPDPKVTAYVNAFAALQAVTGTELAPDALEPNDSTFVATDLGTLSQADSPVNFTGLTFQNAGDRDHLRFTLSDYTRVTVTLTYMSSLSNIDMVLVKESGVPDISGELTNDLRADGMGRELSADLPPGVYRLVLSANNANVYDLDMALSSLSLVPDYYEVNDTLATAKQLPPYFTTRLLNLQNATDNDFLIMSQTSNLFYTSRFEVPERDMQIVLKLYNSSGTLENTVTCGTIGDCGLDMPVGDLGSHTIKVENTGQRGQYRFLTKSVINRDQYLVTGFGLEPINLIDLNPSPATGLLVDPHVLFGFVMDAKAGNAIMTGSDVALSLYDRDGNLLAKQTSSTDPKQPGGSVSLKGLTVGDMYLLKVERTSTPANIDGETGLIPRLPYTIGLTN